jgi:hypothetical protein
MKAYAVNLQDMDGPNENLSIELTTHCNSSPAHTVLPGSDWPKG